MWHRQGKAGSRAWAVSAWTRRLFRLWTKRVDVLRGGKRAGANIGRVGCDCRLNGRTKLGVALHEFRYARGEAEHVLEHEDLAVAGHASTDADGRDFDRGRDAAGERLGHPLDHHPEGTRLRDRARVVLDRPPVVLAAALRAERADGVDGLRREPDMPHDRNAALDQKSDGFGHAATALELDRSA